MRTQRLPGLPKVLRLRGRTVRVRLTALYGVLFVVSGAVLLALASGVVVARSSSSQASPAPTPGQALPGSALAQAQDRVQALRAQLQNLQSQTPSPAGQDRLSHQLLIASLIALAIMTVISVALGWLVAGRALRPVREMTAAAQRISEDSLHERLASRGPQDELKELGDTIDGLLERLEVAFNAQRRFVANASHELRTPLTTMRAAIDVALAKPEPAPPQTVALAERLHTELDRIERLLEAFLVLARAQHRPMPGQAVLPLDYIVGSALADQAAAIRAMDLTVQDSSGQGGAWVAGSQALLSRMVENVIDNAVCHNTPGGWIAITTRAGGGGARLVVENGGQVLDQQQVTELCQPFRRLEADRVGTDKGSGLGLSIVASIAEAHGGTLDLRARPGGGLRVCVSLPAAAATTSAAVPAGVPA
ncbi:MAG: HAMP domain-containing sensor histidine kinase [Streptosporangiaceae bacterium]|jgi:signal transduction histidine kinase